MTQSEQDESIGRLTREYAEAKRKREAIHAELMRHAAFMKQLGESLLANPDRVAFAIGAGEIVLPQDFQFFVTQNLPTVLQLQQLVQNWRDATVRAQTIGESLKRAGVVLE